MAPAPPSIWRLTAGGVWIRVPEGQAIGRDETIAVRYVPLLAPNVALLDERGVPVVRKNGRIGDEVEFIVPRALLERPTGDSLQLSIMEATRPATVKILLQLR